MELRDSYVRLYRSLLDHPLTRQLPAAWFRIFIVILLKANWRPGKWWNGHSEVTIQAGQLVTSIEKLSKITGSSTQQVRGALKYLLATRAITSDTTSRYTVITLVNWGAYQIAERTDNKPKDKPDNNPATESDQGNSKVATTIKEGNNGIRGEGKNNPTDASVASRKSGAKSTEFAFDLAQTSNPKSKHTPEDRTVVALAMARYMDPIGRTRDSVLPPSGIVDEVLAGLGNCTVQQFCKRLGTMPAVYRPGGNKAPKTFRWFIAVAQNLVNEQTLQTPTEELCRHAKPFGTCCNAPKINDAMTSSFDTLDGLDGAA